MDDTTAMVLGGVLLLVFAWIWVRIFSKAGFHAAMGLLMLVPGVNLIVLGVLAFRRWPVQSELRALRGMERSLGEASRRAPSRAA